MRRSTSRFFRTLAATPRPFLDQAEQDVLGADVLVVEPLGFLVGQLHHFAGAVGKAFVHGWFPWVPGCPGELFGASCR